MEDIRAGRCRHADSRRRNVDDVGWTAETHDLRRGRVVFPPAARPRPRASLGHGRLGRGPRLGLELSGGGYPRGPHRGLAGVGNAIAFAGREGAPRRRPRPFGPAEMARWSFAEPALDRGPHDRGVRAPQRPCRSPPRIDRRPDRGVARASLPNTAFLVIVEKNYGD